MKEQRLPDGTWTKNIDLFTAEWDKLRKPFEALGFVVIGFDPGIALRNANNWDSSFVLPVWAAKRIIEAMGAVNKVMFVPSGCDQIIEALAADKPNILNK
jgi:hypothetical protein